MFKAAIKFVFLIVGVGALSVALAAVFAFGTEEGREALKPIVTQLVEPATVSKADSATQPASTSTTEIDQAPAETSRLLSPVIIDNCTDYDLELFDSGIHRGDCRGLERPDQVVEVEEPVEERVQRRPDDLVKPDVVAVKKDIRVIDTSVFTDTADNTFDCAMPNLVTTGDPCAHEGDPCGNALKVGCGDKKSIQVKITP